MNQYDFDILLQKYLSGDCDPEEERLIQEWSETVFANTESKSGDAEKSITEKRIWKGIKSKVFAKPSPLRKIRWGAMIAAATVLLICATLAMYPQAIKVLQTSSVTPAADFGLTIIKDYIEIKNTSDRNQKLSLQDGTAVTLTKGSSLRYPKQFSGKTRRVELVGEAFFNVKRDISRPFFVYTGEIVTQVLGTSFNVKSYHSSKTIEVQVVTGRVSVYENHQKSPQQRNGVILRPNQKITFDKESKKLVPELVEAPVIVETPNKKFRMAFNESSLSQVLSEIQQAYDIEIVVENPELNRCIFTGDLTGLPLHTQLRFICRTINSTYELRGTTFFINGDGCNKLPLKQ